MEGQIPNILQDILTQFSKKVEFFEQCQRT